MRAERWSYDVVKRGLDVTVSAVGLVLSAPVQLVTAGIVLAADGRPVLFRQARPGKDGVVFELVKFRTMRPPGREPRHGCRPPHHRRPVPALDEPGRAADAVERAQGRHEPRRAEAAARGVPAEVQPRAGAAARGAARGDRPGPGVGAQRLSWEDKFALDVEYVDQRSLGLDLAILARTVRSVLQRQGISGDGEATMSVFIGSQPRGRCAMASPERVVVVGASGFGRECLDVLEAMAAAGSPVEVAGVVDDGPSELNLERLAAAGFAYLGTVEEWLAAWRTRCRTCSGSAAREVRQTARGPSRGAGARPFTAIHPSAIFGAQVVVGEGVVVCAGATVSTNVRLGRHVHVNPNATIGHDAVLCDFVSVNPAAVISGEVTIGGGHPMGASATVLQNLAVGEGAIIGAASCGHEGHSADGVVVKGVPAT